MTPFPGRQRVVCRLVDGTGFWYIGHASDGLVTRLRPVVDAFVTEARGSQSLMEALGAWTVEPDKLQGPTSELGQRMLSGFSELMPPEDLFYACAEEEGENETWDLSESDRPRECRAAFAAIASVPPPLVLYSALGPERARRLPGALGVFALSASDAEKEHDTLRHAHALPPVERAQAVTRMHRWLVGTASVGFPVNHLLEALPVVVASAVEAGAGVVAATARG